MSVQQSQARLDALGYSLAIDNSAGPKTYSALFAYMGAKDTAPRFGKAAAEQFPKYGITSGLRVAHFIAQAAAETDSFRYLKELWGPTDAQRRYEGRKDLGNCVPGDGQKFLGRGIFQCTGRDNYQRYGQRCGVDLACNPELAATPELALEIACLYWSDLNLNQFADRDNAMAVGNGINRGNPASPRMPNGFDRRKLELAKAKRVLLP
jgi:putative chitinase